MRNLNLVLCGMALLATGVLAQSLPTATLTASDPVLGGQLGYSVAISGSTVAAAGPGKVYVFSKPSAAPWTDMTESAQLLAAASAVAINGDASVIVAGAPGVGEFGTVYVFVRPDSGWHGTISPVATLTPGPPPKSWVLRGTVGGSVAINSKGDTIVGGAYNAGTQGHLSNHVGVAGIPQQGAAYVWAEPAGGWAKADGAPETAKLTASDGVAYDLFGTSVGIAVNTVAIGAPADKSGASTGSGSVYIFTRPATGTWATPTSFKAKLQSADEKALDGFGSSIAVGNSGALVVAGSGRGCGAGAVGDSYVFVRPSTGWPKTMTQTAELSPSDSMTTCFGLSVSFGSNQVVVGAPAASNGIGDAYIFSKPSKGWSNMSIPVSVVGGSGSSVFGRSSSVSGRTTAVGSPGTTVQGKPSAGAVYLFGN